MFHFVQRAKYMLVFCFLISAFGITRQLLKTKSRHREYNDVDAQFLLRPIAPAYISIPALPVAGRVYRIAVGGALTSKGTDIVHPDGVRALPLFWQLLPSFCRTASVGYEYHFYFGYDRSDPMANETVLSAIDESFRISVRSHCSPLNISIGRLNLIRCEHDSKPAWAQNDAMMAAYLDGMDFFYRLNDDTRPDVGRWTETFIGALANFSPPFVGVVGPSCSMEPPGVMSHDFVHRTHIDVFGFYYPRRFTDWFADNWITNIYGPTRSIRFANVTVRHTDPMGRRYRVREYELLQITLQLARKHADLIRRYIDAKFLPNTSTKHKLTGQRVISMSLYGSKPRYVFGVIRNAQLMPIIYPMWRLRVYYHPKSASSYDHRHLYVADNVLESLRSLGVELVSVTDEILLRDPSMWRYLVLDDHRNVEYALIRNADARITAREARLVDEWLSADLDHTLHCIRDHPTQGIAPLMGGLWGGKGKNIEYAMKRNMKSLIYDYLGTDRKQVQYFNAPNSFLVKIWTETLDKAYCHDSVTCQLWNSSYPAKRLPEEHEVYVGQKFDAFYDGVTVLNITYFESPECIHDSVMDIR